MQTADLKPLPSNRSCVARRVARFDLPAIRRDLLRDRDTESGFTVLNTLLPTAVKTAFTVHDDGRRILVVVHVRDLTGTGHPPRGPARETVELFVNPWNDGLGFYQFARSPDGGTKPMQFGPHSDLHLVHAPYPEAHHSAFEHLALLRTHWILPDWARLPGDGAETHDDESSAFFLAWFDAAALFRNGNAVGFNVARVPGAPDDPQYSREYGSWNPCSGICGPDATSFGVLYRNAPLDWADGVRIELMPGGLRLTGRTSKTGRLAFHLLDPTGAALPLEAARRDRAWRLRVPLSDPLSGRYRLYAKAGGMPVEPRYLAFDLAPADVPRPFVLSMTYDVPDDIGSAPRPYTPAALAAEFDLLRAHGIRRLHWLDYPPETLYRRTGNAGRDRLVRQTRSACGDLLPLAVSLAHARGLAFIGIVKPFDLACDNSLDAVAGRTVKNLENRNIWVPRALAERQDSVQAASAAWFPDDTPGRPVRIRLYSRTPIPPAQASDLNLWHSADNRHFTPYRGPLTVRVMRLRRPHRLWTAAGNIPQPDGAMRHVLELDGLRLPDPYLALQLGDGIRLTERAHALGDAWDADGRLLPVILDRGSPFTPAPGRPVLCPSGFEFWKQLTWHNASPFMLSDVTVGPGVHGLVFHMPRTQPTLLEPCCEGAHAVWLDRIRRVLDAGADGVAVRTLCFHNRVMDHLRTAFAPAVVARFRADYGREPTPDWADAVRVRELRGRGYTAFLRRAKALAAAAGRTLALHLECGIELPPTRDQRTQFNLEWETWIREGIADELLLKWWFAQNPFIHERVLPLARKHGVPVHIIDRNGSLKTPRAIERAEALARESRDAGFAGLAWYEAAAWKRRNRENAAAFRGLVGDAIRLAARRSE